MRCPLLGAIIALGTFNVALAQESKSSGSAELIVKENIVEARSQSSNWTPAFVGQAVAVRDRLRTGEDSRAAVRLADASILRFDELTETEILPPQHAGDKATLDLKAGSAYFFSREQAREIKLQTPAANGAIRGTEFTVAVARAGRTTVTMLDGELELSNAAGTILVHSGERADVEPGQRPTKTAVIEVMGSVQWCLYYPGVLNLRELGLSNANRSTVAYEEGDLLTALERYPAGDQTASVYRAGLYLVVGQVDKARRVLRQLPAGAAGRSALSTLIAAVTLQDKAADTAPPRSSSEWLAESYYRQSNSDLTGALAAAEQARDLDPHFGFGWIRIAELEFSFGRIPQAKQALSKGIKLSPRNPAAYTLQGFVLSAENNISAAKSSFQHAVDIDGALGSAWLGHGLCLIRRGEAEAGRRELQIAAALEPNRSIFHSYLGKAFSNAGNSLKAEKELTRAKELDPGDPTPWLYSAIEKRQNSRVNDAVRDLERSLDLNDERRIYRSQFLLDQDRAVRSANLAAIYQDAGMEDVSVREATRAVDDDYSNASSHLFLANSYNALRDPKRINLRYETPWFNELLLANLLSPVGGGPLSQYVSEQEYSKLFEADRFGIASTTNYFGYGEVRETASQYATFGNFSYSIDTEYDRNPGRRPNNEIKRSETYGQMKYQLTPYDILFLQTKYQDVREGDLFQRYNQWNFEPGLHVRELQQPAIVLAGFRHEWSPGVHTLLLAGRLADEVTLSDLNSAENRDQFVLTGMPNASRSLIFLRPSASEPVTGVAVLPLDLHYHNSFTTYTGEVNQIWETPANTFVAGARVQSGEFHTSDKIDNPPPFASRFFSTPAAAHDFITDLERESFYVYDTWRPWANLSLTAGIAYDHLSYPADYRNPPLLAGDNSRDRLSPKAGLVWNPIGHLNVRAAYSRSLGGVSFDESVQLEPNQVAGFNQVFRTIIAESVVGSVAAPRYETAGFLIEDKFASGTYVGVEATLLREQVEREIGNFTAFTGTFGIDPPIVSSATPEKLDYEEHDLVCSVNQLIGRDFSVGARYQFSFSDLNLIHREIPRSLSPGAADSRLKGSLHQGELFAVWNHPSGLFARAEGYWAQQSNVGYSPDTPGDNLIQLNAYVGYRFRRNYGDITIGFLNLTDANYKLNPLNYYNELPRDRTFFARVRFNF